MKSIKKGIKLSGLLLLALLFVSCSSQPPMQESEIETPDDPIPMEEGFDEPAPKPTASAGLPIQYQKPSYVVDVESHDDLSEDGDVEAMKVGASIQSTRGPEPLGEILRILARSKGYSISWASDVDRNVLVDVNIDANDEYHRSIKNLLRQVDYFHEFNDNSIIVKYKETRQFHIAMPFTTQVYSTGTGGNVLGGNDASDNVDGTIELKSEANEFDIWKNIASNMDAIIATWNTRTVSGTLPDAGDGTTAQAARQVSSGNSMYIIDKPVGLITVSAPRPLLDRLDKYFTSLKRELYKQINIEAKIIEVHLTDNSSIGINWTKILDSFQLSGLVEFGDAFGMVWPNPNADSFVRSISLNAAPFDVFLNALKEEGDTNILSNPKISVMNGQPALITVGRNTTYIDKIDAKENNTSTGTTFTYTVQTERILSGVGLALTATILNDDEVIMNLVPVTSQLEEPIEYKAVGLGEVGLPIVNVREMSTTVKVKNGEMLVIGGLIDNTTDTQGEFLPILGSIPLLKYMFGHEEKIQEKRELIILLKPTIL